MTVRVLSLFDDDDFLPEKPKDNNSPEDKDNIKNNNQDSNKNDVTETIASPNSFISIELPEVQNETNNITEAAEENISENSLDSLYKEAIMLSDYTQFTDFEDKINTKETEKYKEQENIVEESQNDYNVTENFVFEESAAPPPTPQKELQVASIELPEWNLEKKYYGISEVAKLFNANISHIRFWTNEFNIKIRTNKKGDRLYTPENIELLKKIHYIVKVKKHTIKGAKEILKNKSLNIEEEMSLKNSLESLKEQLLIIRSNL